VEHATCFSNILLPGRWIQELEQKGELADGDPLNNFFKKIFAQVSLAHAKSTGAAAHVCVCRHMRAAGGKLIWVCLKPQSL